MATRYYLSLPEPKAARGSEPAFSFDAQGADAFARQLEDALRTDTLVVDTVTVLAEAVAETARSTS